MISPLKRKTLGHFPLVSVLSLTFSQLHFLVNEKLVDLVPIYRTIKHTHTFFNGVKWHTVVHIRSSHAVYTWRVLIAVRWCLVITDTISSHFPSQLRRPCWHVSNINNVEPHLRQVLQPRWTPGRSQRSRHHRRSLRRHIACKYGGFICKIQA